MVAAIGGELQRRGMGIGVCLCVCVCDPPQVHGREIRPRCPPSTACPPPPLPARSMDVELGFDVSPLPLTLPPSGP